MTFLIIKPVVVNRILNRNDFDGYAVYATEADGNREIDFCYMPRHEHSRGIENNAMEILEFSADYDEIIRLMRLHYEAADRRAKLPSHTEDAVKNLKTETADALKVTNKTFSASFAVFVAEARDGSRAVLWRHIRRENTTYFYDYSRIVRYTFPLPENGSNNYIATEMSALRLAQNLATELDMD